MNIVFIASDQHRAGLTKRSGYLLNTSPMLDKLADNGVSFDRVPCPSVPGKDPLNKVSGLKKMVV